MYAMSIVWQCLIILLVLTLKYSGLIYSITDGSLNRSWRLNFSIFSNDIKGVLLYCIDSSNNQLGIIVTRDMGNMKFIRLTFNHNQQVTRLQDMCDCDPCNGTSVNFTMQLSNSVLTGACNNRAVSAWITFTDRKYRKSNNILYPTPKKIINANNKLYIMMDNIGPYDSDTAVTFPKSDQMIGCVNHLYYDDRKITFFGNGSKLRSSCPLLCVTDACNGGLCHNMYPSDYTCDCSSTALNGRYCNRSLDMYNRGANNYYEKINNVTKISLKMTWKLVLYKSYCLMNIVNKFNNATISINNNNHLMIDSTVIADINKDVTNFVSVTFADNNLIINNYLHKTSFSLDETMGIELGYSDNNDRCVTFEGAYDLYLNYSELGLIDPQLSTSTRGIPRNMRNINYSSNNCNTQQSIWFYLSMVLGNVIIIWSIVLLAVKIREYLKNKRTHCNDRVAVIIKPPKATNHIDGTATHSLYSALDYQYISGISNSLTDYTPMSFVNVNMSPTLPPRNVT